MRQRYEEKRESLIFAPMVREVIKSRMEQLELTQAYIVRELELNKSNFSQFLKGNRTLPLTDIERVCSLLNLVLKPND